MCRRHEAGFLGSVAATLTIADTGRPIVLRTKYILLQRNGGLQVGTETRPYTSPLDIILYGLSDDPYVHPIFGRKFIGVDRTAFIDIRGPWKRSWTFLARTLQPGVLSSLCFVGSMIGQNQLAV